MRAIQHNKHEHLVKLLADGLPDIVWVHPGQELDEDGIIVPSPILQKRTLRLRERR